LRLTPVPCPYAAKSFEAAALLRRCFRTPPGRRSWIGVKYGEHFVIKETMRVNDIPALGVRSL
jgi:hypothetical protein